MFLINRYIPNVNPSFVTSMVFNEDCMEVMKRYPDGYFDLAVVDIPYGIDVANMAYLTKKNNFIKQSSGKRLNGNRSKKTYTLKDWDKQTPSQEYFNELKRVSKNQIIFGVEYVNWTGLGKGRIKWNKGVAKGMSFKNYEMIYCSMIDHQIEIDLLWSGMQQAKSLKEPTTPQGNKKLNEKRIHPCHKPILLYNYIYSLFGFSGMKVIDTHLGGGSNRISADTFGFEFVAAEIDHEYFCDQENRYLTYKNTLRLPLM